jgi:hypothetical protein
MKRFVTLLFSISTVSALFAQFTSIGTLPTYSGRPTKLLRTLITAGPKLIEPGTDGCILHNMDLSTYLTITYPAPPAGFAWNTWVPEYFTEDLFDNDPSTIEFLMIATEINGPDTAGTAVLRADGTLVFWVEGETPYGIGGDVPYTISPSIFNTPQGAIMELWNAVAGEQGQDINVHYYQLPGMLPCVECDGTISASMMQLGGAPDEMPPTPGITAFPNPASSTTEIVLNANGAGTIKAVRLVDMDGRAVKRIPVAPGASRLSISIADVASGTYAYQLETDSGIVPGTRLVVVR